MQTSESINATKLFNKVPEVTLIFWVIKIMATTVGETAADFLAFNMRVGMANTTYIMGGLLLICLTTQLKAKQYKPWLYWLTVVLISIFGTLLTDNLVDNLGVSLVVSTIGFSLALLVAFIVWFVSEKTLSIHTIYTRKRELFYWSAILFTFALGTAAGDLFAEGYGLGYAKSALVFGVLIGVVTGVYYGFQANAVAAFWFAYILTRPFGASCGDFLSQSHQYGGLGLATVNISILFLVTILGLVVYLTRQKQAK